MSKFRHALYSYQDPVNKGIVTTPVVIIGHNEGTGICVLSKFPIPGGWGTNPSHVQEVMTNHYYKFFDALTGQDLKILDFRHGKFVSMISLELVPELESIVLDIDYELKTNSN